MNIKNQLAELCSKRMLSMSEYVELPAFKLLEQQNELIEKLEPFHLPEITKLICGSNNLFSLPWAKPYERIKDLFWNLNDINVIQVISDCNSVESFEKDVLNFSDGEVLAVFKKFYKDIDAHENIIKQDKEHIERQIQKGKKKKKKNSENENGSHLAKKNNDTREDCLTGASLEEDDSLSGNEREAAKLEEELKQISDFKKKHKGYIEKIYIYDEKIKQFDSDLNRENAYQLLSKTEMCSEEIFLNKFISSGVVSEQEHSCFHDTSFLEKVLSCLENESYKGYLVPILLKLYDEGAVDLIEGSASDCLKRNESCLLEYLLENTPLTPEKLENNGLDIIVSKAIDVEIKKIETQKKTVFFDLWNTIIDPLVWDWMIELILATIGKRNVNVAIASLMVQLKGRAAKVFVEVLFKHEKMKNKISAGEIVDLLVKVPEYREGSAIIEITRYLEQNNRKIKRKLNTAERKNRSQGQELFSSIYSPMEQLEELAVNLKATNGDIKASLVAAHLMDIIISLREGYETLEVYPLVEMEDWKNQVEVKFNQAVHKVTAKMDTTLNVVKLNSMGFRYQDDEGVSQQYKASASINDGKMEQKKPSTHIDVKNDGRIKPKRKSGKNSKKISTQSKKRKNVKKKEHKNKE